MKAVGDLKNEKKKQDANKTKTNTNARTVDPAIAQIAKGQMRGG
jgi:hypothetical protein